MKKFIVTAGAALALMASSTAYGAASHESTTVNWHPQQAAWHTGQVDRAEASLVRNDNGVRYRLRTTGLTPGNVYTLWIVVVNEPGECDPSPCTAPDVIANDVTRSQVSYAGGHVAGQQTGTFAGHISVGALDGWLDDRALEDARRAEIHLVVNDHGPLDPASMPGMLSTYRGGCSDASPFPGIFPPSAIGDGEPGPNICRLYQSAIFMP